MCYYYNNKDEYYYVTQPLSFFNFLKFITKLLHGYWRGKPKHTEVKVPPSLTTATPIPSPWSVTVNNLFHSLKHTQSEMALKKPTLICYKKESTSFLLQTPQNIT